MSDEHKEAAPAEKPLSFKQVAQSVAAAAFGVQSGKNRERDFSRGKPSHFIVLGLLFTLALILLIFGIVQLVLHLAGL